MTDALGSVLAVISNTESSAALLSNQVFAPYGKPLSQNGNMSQYTNKGFTSQYNDLTSGLDYYVSRYYDPVSGVFLSADTAEGNLAGMNPYSYVGNNPEIFNDPTGQAYIPPGGGGNGGNGNGNNNNGNGNNGGGGGSGGGGGCGLWNLWCWTWGGGSGNSSLKVLADSLPFGLGGEASQIQGPEGMDGILDGQMAEVDAQLTEEGELQTLEAEVPQLVNDPGDALQAAEMSEQGVETFKGDIAQEEVAQDVKEYGDSKPVTTNTSDTTNTSEPTNSEQNFGRGTKFSHFTDANGVKGITGVDPGSLNVGQTISVNGLSFGQGANSYMAEEPGDIFVTELGTDATARQLAQIGVFDEKQSFVIQFSQEAAIMNDIRTFDTGTGRSIFTIPGDSILSGFDFLVTRLR